MHYPAILIPKQNSAKHDVIFPDFPGCVSQGENFEDALTMATEALELHTEEIAENDLPAADPEAVKAALKMAQEEHPDAMVCAISLKKPVQQPVKDEVIRLNISLTAGVLKSIDHAAEEIGLTRSGLIAVATRYYIKSMQT